ncbi:MAG: hypothetical protein IH571_05105, partial [Acholeplasmataceae bacterium]|nr:hypothetical protein [Acholeplasmataceae bacterium]
SPMLFTSPNQSINYVECHDNLTFYDKMLLSCGFENPNFTYCQDLANHIIAISQGVPFYHAGQEFYRSKKGVENAYNSPDEINRIHWPKDVEPIKKLKKLLKLRKRFKLYRMTSYGDQIVIRKERDLIVYQLEDAKHLLIHYIKNKHGIEELPLVQGQLIFPSQAFYAQSDAIIVDQPGVYIVHIKK